MFKPDFEIVWGLNSKLSSEPSYSLCMALLAARVGLVLWPDYGLVVDSPRTKSRIVLYVVFGMIVWPVMACGVNCFMGISYATTSLED